MLRPMSGFEMFVWFYGKQAPTNSVTGARFHGKVGFEEMAAAVDFLAGTGELPRLCILEKSPGDFWISDECPGAISLRKVAGNGPEEWTGVAARELELPFEEGGPMVRLVAVEHATGLDLLCVTSHAFSDGMSKVALFNRLAEVLTGNGASTERLFLAPPMEKSLPPEVSGHWLNRAIWWFQAQAMLLTSARRAGGRRPEASGAPSYYVSLHRRMAGPRVVALLEGARAHDCSLHGVIAAALLRALGPSGEKRRRRLSSPVNLRRRLNFPAGNSWGLHIGFVDTDATVDPAEPFWTFARRLSEKIRKSVHSDEPLMLAGLVGTLVRTPRGRSLLMTLDPGKAKHDLAVSNLGQHSPRPAGSSTLVEFLGPCVCGDDGERVVGVSLVGDTLNLTLTQRRQDTTEDAGPFLDRAVSLLSEGA